jgi:hypothetical protein
MPEEPHLSVELVLAKGLVSALLGVQGQGIKRIMDLTGCNVHVFSSPREQAEQAVELYGTEQQVGPAGYCMHDVVQVQRWLRRAAQHHGSPCCCMQGACCHTGTMPSS